MKKTKTYYLSRHNFPNWQGLVFAFSSERAARNFAWKNENASREKLEKSSRRAPWKENEDKGIDKTGTIWSLKELKASGMVQLTAPETTMTTGAAIQKAAHDYGLKISEVNGMRLATGWAIYTTPGVISQEDIEAGEQLAEALSRPQLYTLPRRHQPPSSLCRLSAQSPESPATATNGQS